MADDFLAWQNPAATDERLDTESLTVGGFNVHRERVQLAGATDVAIAAVQNSAPTTEYGVVTRNIPSGTQTVAGTVTANAGTNLNTSLLALEAGGNLAAIAASASVMDDWDETNRAAVNTIAGQVGVQGGAGASTALTQRVAIATDANAISGTVTANAGTNLNTSLLALESGGNLAGAATSLAVIDDWDETDRAKVNLIVGQAGIAADAGAIGATTPRVVFGTTATSLSDGTPNPSIQALAAFNMAYDGSGWNRVSSSKPMPVTIVSGGAGDGAILDGVSSSIKASVLDYTNSNPLAVRLTDTNGDYIAAGAGTQYTEGDTDASITGTAMLMEGAADTLLPVQGTVADGLLVNLGSNNDVTVTGSVTANAGTNLNTSLLALEAGGNLAGAATSLAIIDDWDESDRAKVNPIAGQVGVAAGSGTIDALTQRTVFGATSSSLSDGTPNPSVQALAALAMSWDGSGWNRVGPTKAAAVRQYGPFYSLASSDDTPITTATDTTLVAAPGLGMKLRIAYIQASNSSSTTTDVMWRDGASGTRRYRTTLAQNSTFAHNIKPGAWDLTNNTALVMTTSAAGSVHWIVEYETVSTSL